MIKPDALIDEFSQYFPASREHHRKAEQVLPGGITHDSRFRDPFPVYISRAEGPYKWSIEGHKLIDYGMGHGALLLGHGHPTVREAIEKALAGGTHFSAPHRLKLQWAELICELVPSAEMVRFTGSGTESTHLALRLARAATGRSRILRIQGHFHGWHDEVMSGARPPFEIPASTGTGPGTQLQIVAIPPNDLRLLEGMLETRSFAAFIVEPTGASFGTVPLEPGYLQKARELTAATGTILIFEEVISGFRMALGGAQQYYGVTPDLTCLAKIVAGGMPGAAVAGRRDLLSLLAFTGDPQKDRFQRVAHQGTFNANPVTAAAGVATLSILRSGEPQDQAAAIAARLRQGINEVMRAMNIAGVAYGESSFFHVYIDGDCPIQFEEGSPARISDWRRVQAGMPGLGALRRALFLEGVDLLRDGGFVSAVHTAAEIDATIDAFRRAFKRLF